MKLPPERPSAVGPKYLEQNCIPKNMEYLSKKVKTFLSKDANEVARKLHFESYYIQQDQRNVMVMMDLTRALQPYFPLTKCYLFGSRTFGTASFESDIDIFTDLENNYCGRKGNTAKLDPRKSVQLIAALLERNPLWRILCVTTSARIPLLQVIHKSCNLKCDISFTSGLAHCNSSLLNYLFDLQPNCRALVCYIKNWNSDSSLTGYAIALMAVFFFQCYNLLPSVHRLQNDLRAARNIDDWNAGFTTHTLTQLGIPPCTVPISTLTKQFFAFYGDQGPNFSLETDVVCPFLGRCGIKKSMFHATDASEIPKEMHRLRSYTCEHKNDPNRLNLFAYDRPFVIQDPFELCHNVAKGLNECQAAKYLRKFHQCSIFQPSLNDL
ncbi:terminal uridylyltransferase Tailor-like [Anopheles cruzii]|uniref:terminal uridylyltransferase Tailor-like n=1 Tax=Anopheles cruzii TaxID=68878 RepID=UPI0022EC2CD2|nr:terminal uridylyltransferase Tailor-like [Anopheles cruzii]